MDRHAGYDHDIYAWSQEQAEVLRDMARTRRDLPNALDLENVAEEIESVGRSELKSVESFIILILCHLAKAASEPDSPALRHWRAEVVAWQQDLARSFTPSMRAKIHMDRLWELALRRAEAAMAEHDRTLAEGRLPAASPVTLEEMLADGFDFAETLARLAPG
jgi:hypothetical protein